MREAPGSAGTGRKIAPWGPRTRRRRSRPWPTWSVAAGWSVTALREWCWCPAGPIRPARRSGWPGAVGPENVHALHLNYGLRDSADRDERACRDLCSRLRIDLHIERPAELDGNLQAAAREARYAAAEQLRVRSSADWIATGHTRTDLAETVLYRLAVSPWSTGASRPAGAERSRGATAARAGALRDAPPRRAGRAAFADDETNLDPGFARNRIRAEVLPVLRELSPAAERNVAETRAELEEEAQLLERVVLEALEAAGAGAGAVAIRADALQGTEPALRRLAFRALAERATGRAGLRWGGTGRRSSCASRRSPRAARWTSGRACGASASTG